MKRSSTIFRAGTRASKLALTQTNNALKKLTELFPFFSCELESFSSPGDRDRQTDLRASDQDFFTRDLDNAVMESKIDFAVHSAKDLPENIRDGLDWFWLPWREDPRDVLIFRKGEDASSLPEKSLIGVSSERREKYSLSRFPQGELKPIRGNIEDRVKQLDNGDYDVLVMAAAGLLRLDLEDRINEYISINDLPPPDGQGYLAITFKKGHGFFENLRKIFVKSVVFAGSGPGNPGYVTVEAVNALKTCDVCLYDALSPDELLSYLPNSARAVYVGKRQGQHSMKQEEICSLIVDYARQGKKVARLKGGDPGIFGRLAEEIDALDELSLSYRVIPGISSMNAATTGTGLLLTRRGTSRGFSAMTPRRSGSKEFEKISADEMTSFPMAFFMGVSELPNIVDSLIENGRSENESAAVIFSAGTDQEKTVCSTLSGIAEKAKSERDNSQPGIFIVGENAHSKFLYKNNGALRGKKVLLTCSEAIMDKAAMTVFDLGGKPVCKSLIKLKPNPSAKETLRNISEYNWLVTTSPSAAKCLMALMKELKIDLRELPKIMVCGPGTAKEFIDNGVYPCAEPDEKFGADGLCKKAAQVFGENDKILRLKSDLAKPGKLLFKDLEQPLEITDCELYSNESVKYDFLPEFDSVVFASSSAVKAFVENWGKEALAGKKVSAIGEPTKKMLLELCIECKIILSQTAMIASAVESLAIDCVFETLKGEFSL
jgi:uroporphyrinogen III methyltransferase/synthase